MENIYFKSKLNVTYCYKSLLCEKIKLKLVQIVLPVNWNFAYKIIPAPGSLGILLEINIHFFKLK